MTAFSLLPNKLSNRQYTIYSHVLQRTYPFNEENWKGENHGLVLAVVQLIHVGVICVQVVGPGGPGTEHHHRAPDEHHEVDDGHDPAGHLVDSHADLLAAVDLPVSLSALLVDLGPGVDGCEELITMKTTFLVVVWQTYSWRPGDRSQPRTASRRLHWDRDHCNRELLLLQSLLVSEVGGWVDQEHRW